MTCDLRPEVRACFDAFGVPAVVTRPAPEETPVATTIVWFTPAMEDVPSGGGFGRRDTRLMLAVMRSEVPTLPRKTLIDAPERLGAPVRRWRVDAIDLDDVDEIRAIVVPEPEPRS
jgi:hypothetical protein